MFLALEKNKSAKAAKEAAEKAARKAAAASKRQSAKIKDIRKQARKGKTLAEDLANLRAAQDAALRQRNKAKGAKARALEKRRAVAEVVNPAVSAEADPAVLSPTVASGAATRLVPSSTLPLVLLLFVVGTHGRGL